MKTLFVILILLFLPSENILPQWKTLPAINDYSQRDICYLSPANTFILTTEGILLSTTDGGESWNEKRISKSSLNSICITEDGLGFIAGDNGVILKTLNGGYSWRQTKLKDYVDFSCIDFYNDKMGVVAGTKQVFIDGREYFLPSVYVTDNGGKTWKEVDFNIEGRINSVCFISESKVIAVGDCGQIFISDDSGITWKKKAAEISSNLKSVIHCYHYNLAAIAGEEGTFLYSIDKGVNWKKVLLPDYFSIENICLKEAGIIAAAGSMRACMDGKKFLMAVILEIDPLQNKWKNKFCDVRGKYNSISFCNPDLAMAVGDDGIKAVYENQRNNRIIQSKNKIQKNSHKSSDPKIKDFAFLSSGDLQFKEIKNNERKSLFVDDSIVLRWDTGLKNYLGLGEDGTVIVAVRFPDTIMSKYSNYKLTQIEIGMGGLPSSLVLKVFNAGTDTSAGRLLYSKKVNQIGEYKMNAFEIEEDIPITGEDLWIGYEVTMTRKQFVIGMDNGPLHPDGDWLFDPQDSSYGWYHLSDFGVYQINWVIRAHLKDGQSTDIIDFNNSNAKAFSLSQNYPNPFNPSTKIMFSIPISGEVQLKVFDILGKEISTLIDQYKTAGSYTVDFDASEIKSGIYFYQLIIGRYSSTKKMIVLK